jgi:outer membrane lipoprotein
MRKLFILALPYLLFISGCAHNISQQSLAMADHSITFTMLQENPDAYRGKFVLLGGAIMGAKQTQLGIEYEVNQYNLDSRETPDVTSASGGRFLAITAASLGVPLCKTATLVSMVGEVAGREVRQLKGVDYRYPVIIVKELYIARLPSESDNYFRTWSPYGP